MTTPTMTGGHPDEVLDLMQALNRDCGICGHTIEKSSWVTHRGLRCHPSCWAKSKEAPDIVAGRGKYAPDGEYGGAA